MGGSGHSWRECSTPRQGNNLPFKPNHQSPNQGNRPNLNGQQREKTQASQSSPSANQGGVHTNKELREVRVWDEPEYYNPSPWSRILGRANETDVEIDGIIIKALIGSGAMILMMTRDYCDEHGYEIQPLEHLVPKEGSGGPMFLIWGM